MVYRIRRHRRIGDRFELRGSTYEVTGLCGYVSEKRGSYLIVLVTDGKAGTYVLQTTLDKWVEDTTTTRPFPFEAAV